MDDKIALEDLRNEVEQIINNYFDSYRRTRGHAALPGDFVSENDSLMKLYIEYGIIVFGYTLELIDFLISAKSKK